MMALTYRPCDCEDCRNDPRGPWMIQPHELDGQHPKTEAGYTP